MTFRGLSAGVYCGLSARDYYNFAILTQKMSGSF